MDRNDELVELRAQVRRLTDIEDIKQLTARYMQAMHDARWSDAADCFSDQASYDHGPLGELADKASIRKFYTEFMKEFEEAGGWKFFQNRCVSEHQMVSYANGWGAKGNSRVTSFTEAEQSGQPLNFERIRAAGGKKAPGKLTRSIRGWTVPTQEPER